MSLPGTRWPSIEDCPDCGNDTFDAVEVASQGMTIRLDEYGGIGHMSMEELLESSVTFMECLDCGATIVEDGEVVHEDVKGGA